jgi:hypothetical protein
VVYIISGTGAAIWSKSNFESTGHHHDSHIVFVKKFPGEKGSVRRNVVVMQQPVVLSPNFGAKSSHISTQSP